MCVTIYEDIIQLEVNYMKGGVITSIMVSITSTSITECDLVQNRAMRYFLGVHGFTSIPALNGEMGVTLQV